MNSPDPTGAAANGPAVLLELSLAELDLIRSLKVEYDAACAGNSDWVRFKRFWWDTVLGYYDGKGLPRKTAVETVAYQYGSELDGRLMEAAGITRPAGSPNRVVT